MCYLVLQFRLHELTHHRRRDVVIKWCGVFLTSLHWFNPFAWQVRRQLDRTCELSCDGEVIRSFDDTQKQDYGNTLIEMAAQSRVPRQVVSAGVCEEKKNLKDRLTAIMESRPFTRGAAALSAVLTVLALCTMAVLGASQTAVEIDPDSVVSAHRMTFVEGKDEFRPGYVPFYDDFKDLQEAETLSDTYTEALVAIINSYSKTPMGPFREGMQRYFEGQDQWIRLDCEDGGY